MLKFTTAALSGAAQAEDTPSQELGAKAITTDGQVAIYTQASVDIAAHTACKITADGKAALTGNGVACKSDYALAQGQYGWVTYPLPVTAAA
ncbi:hypothetical protein [Candidatus Avelusimicrobium facis]|uniref:hypothetical protein n=1 Tax=Candidatus Avelusimicrobium facis TaxID=3416203 RepID=UPI0015B597F5|nr:MAG TPA: hypothetical protein [Caudoviricetes sp.]